MRIILSLAATIILVFSFTSSAEEINPCDPIQNKNSLLGAFAQNYPYQIQKTTPVGTIFTGMDVEITKAILGKLKMSVTESNVDLDEQFQNLQNGAYDLVPGMDYRDDRGEYAYFSIPYRFETNSIFSLKSNPKTLNTNNVKEALTQIKSQNYRLGIVSGSIYPSDELNNFIKDSANQDIIISLPDNISILQALTHGDVDGIIIDRVVGSASLISSGMANMVQETPLNLSTPIHFMLSKKTVSLELVEQINSVIANFVLSKEYKDITGHYFIQASLLNVINSDWFNLLCAVGIIVFAISGIFLASQENTTLLGALLFALLPSIGGGIMRDVILSRDKVAILMTPSYIYYVLIIAFVGFILMKCGGKKDCAPCRFTPHIIAICDAIGQGCFIALGVVLALYIQPDNIWLWGPFFAFLTANGGGIIRDCVRKNTQMSCISGEIDAEVSLIWGLIFSICLSYIATGSNAENVRYTTCFVIAGATLTRLITHYFKISNVYFRK